MQCNSVDWQTFGLVLALVFVFSMGLAFLTRLVNNHKLRGQTFWLVVVGVAMVVAMMGFVIGWLAVGLLVVGFAVAAIPMAVEYFWRTLHEQFEANTETERNVQ